MGSDVDRVGDEHVDGVRSHLDQVRHDGLEDVDGSANELKTRLTRLLTRTSGDDDHVGVAADLVGTVDGHGRVEAGAMLHVEHFGFHALLGDVFKHDLASDATLGSGEGEGGANGTGTNNSKLRGLNGSFRHDG